MDQNTKSKSGRRKQPLKNQAEKAVQKTASTRAKKPAAAAKPAPARTKTAALADKLSQPSRQRTSKLKIIPLGGLDEIGKNMTVIEYRNDIIVIDCGMAFPGVDMLGIDLVLPNISYLEKNREKIRGVFITHGHEDHIGGLPYFLKQFDVPVYGNRLTLGLIRRKLDEHGITKRCKLIECQPGSIVQSGCFNVEFIKVNHSIADSAAFAIHTPVGVLLHTGDFKIDTTPIRGRMIDLARMGQLGKKGVLLLMSDSTNAERPGMAMSEKKVGNSLDMIFERASEQRIIVASFASNIHRVQQIINSAVKCGRKVSISGRSMENVMAVAMELGYLTVPEGTLIPLDTVSRYPKEKVLIITTGSQGEPMSALYRMAFSDHRSIAIDKGDLVVISASPIPGNERFVSAVINELYKLGAEVVSNSLAAVHVSGHACQEELKLILNLVKPKYFMPVHGEYKHLRSHARLAIETGMDENDIFIMENGSVLELGMKSARVSGSVPSGQILVDGLGIGDVGNIVLRDRRLLSQDGIIIVVAGIDPKEKKLISGPDIISRGFIYVRENEDLIEKARALAKDTLEKGLKHGSVEWSVLKNDLKDALGRQILSITKRRPMIIPILLDM